MYSSSTRSLASEVLKLANEKNIKLATAESCTGGLVAGSLTDVPGSSNCVLGGIVSYDNEVKITILGVKKPTLQSVGAVSLETAEEMALGALRTLNANLAVSTTGIAGPGGGTPEKPVGTVCFGIATSIDGKSLCSSFRYFFEGDRQQVRESAVNKALTLLLDTLNA